MNLAEINMAAVVHDRDHGDFYFTNLKDIFADQMKHKTLIISSL